MRYMNFDIKGKNVNGGIDVKIDEYMYTIISIEGDNWHWSYDVSIDEYGMYYKREDDNIINKVYFKLKVTGRTIKTLEYNWYCIKVRIFTDFDENENGFLGKIYLSYLENYKIEK